MIRRRNLRTRSIKLLVLDEADEMLNKGFKEQLYDIYRYLPPGAQVRRFICISKKNIVMQISVSSFSEFYFVTSLNPNFLYSMFGKFVEQNWFWRISQQNLKVTSSPFSSSLLYEGFLDLLILYEN